MINDGAHIWSLAFFWQFMDLHHLFGSPQTGADWDDAEATYIAGGEPYARRPFSPTRLWSS